MTFGRWGGVRSNFAEGAQLLRIDIDKDELEYQVRADEIDIQADAQLVIAELEKQLSQFSYNNLINSESSFTSDKYADWLKACNEIKEAVNSFDKQTATDLVNAIGEVLPDDVTITTDVGQNQVWVAQKLRVKEHQRILFSAGHGAMGYSLPAAIGAYYGTRKPVIAFMGDGGFQMNIQEMEFLQRDQPPVKVVVFNNYALGMIRHFQEMYFDSNYVDTICGRGYDVPDLSKIATAYGVEYHRIVTKEQINGLWFDGAKPALIEVCIFGNTYVYPKLRFGQPNQNQEPLLPKDLYEKLMKL